MNIPFVDLKQQYENLKAEIDTAMSVVIENTAFIKGPQVGEFENRFGASLGIDHVIGCANGTDAIFIALKALGIGPGDEVITVCNTWISTSETISLTGAKPVFVDISPDSYLIDLGGIESKITNRTKAIIPVHLYGQAVPMPEIMNLANKYNLKVIEDCAQAYYSSVDGQFVGTFGDVATFSFFPGKNLGAYGDAGGIATANSDLAETIRMLANHGGLKKNVHRIEGLNSRLDTLQAAVLNVKLDHILKWTSQRQEAAVLYTELLTEQAPEVVLPIGKEIKKTKYECTHVFHLYVIRSKFRDDLKVHLEKKGIATGIHYPSILPLTDAYSYLNLTADDFPVAASYQSQILSLPIFPEITEEQIRYVVASIAEFYLTLSDRQVL